MLFWAEWGVRLDIKISAILLKYANVWFIKTDTHLLLYTVANESDVTFEGVAFIFSWAKKPAQLYQKKLKYIIAQEHKNNF